MYIRTNVYAYTYVYTYIYMHILLSLTHKRQTDNLRPLHEIFVVLALRRVAQGPQALDPGQLNCSLLINANAIPHNSETAILEGAGTCDHLPLALALQIDDAEVLDWPQVREGF